MKHNKAGKKVFIRLSYQKKGKEYLKKSIYLSGGVYEMWCDVRKAYKLSASYVIAIAIQLYLDGLLKCEDDPFNYVSLYVTKPKYYGEVYTNLIIWGLPDEETLNQLLEI